MDKLSEEKSEYVANELEQDAGVGQFEEYHATPAEELKVLRKLDFFLLPTMGLCYMLQYMDKLALSQATLLGLRKDLGLVGQQYTWCSAIFYFGYLAWSWPTSYLIVRLPLGKYLAVCVFLWGGILMCHAAVEGYGGLITARFFLGVGEAAVAPGFALVTGMFYKRDEQPARQGAWFIGNSVANIIGGIIAYGIGNLNSSLQSWRLLFLILGSVTSGYAIVLFFILPDSPATASFLTPNERTIAAQRTISNKTGIAESNAFQWSQAWEAVRDPQVVCLVIYTFLVNIGNGGLTSFSGIIISGFGFSDLKSLLIQMPLGAAQIVFLFITAAIATFVPKSRIGAMIFNVLVSLIGTVLIYTLPDTQRAAKMLGLCFVAVFAVNIPLCLSIVTSNIAGATKRSTVSVGVFAAYCVGNIVGPQFFLASEEPTYPTGIRASLCGFAIGIFFLVSLLTYYIWENKRRDSHQGVVTDTGDIADCIEEQISRTDKKISGFRYVY